MSTSVRSVQPIDPGGQVFVERIGDDLVRLCVWVRIVGRCPRLGGIVAEGRLKPGERIDHIYFHVP